MFYFVWQTLVIKKRWEMDITSQNDLKTVKSIKLAIKFS